MIFLFEIGFMPVGIFDLLDVLIVGYLMYRIYLLLRGSIAFNIFLGIVMLYLVWWLVSLLKMELLTQILTQFVNVGFIIIIIIFQPEVRRFLLLLGNTTLGGKANVFARWLARRIDNPVKLQSHLHEIRSAILRMAKDKTGALIIFSKNLDLGTISPTGVELDAQISQSLLLSIFQKESPLHDGAVIIGRGKILAASCILPISDSTRMKKSAGLRHRAGLGISERTNALALIVSEESGAISFAFEGKIEFNISESRLTEVLTQHLDE